MKARTAAQQDLARHDSPHRGVLLAVLALGILAACLLSVFQDPNAVEIRFSLGIGRWIAVVAVMAIAALPPIARRLSAAMTRVAHPTTCARFWAAVAIAVCAAAYLVVTAHLQGRDLFPKVHDDQSYLIQMQMLARGRLWMPPHPLHDFFDTFYVLVRPVYASLYFPGAAMLYVPTVWLGLPTWLMPACVAGACVSLLYRLVTEAIDGVAGLLAAIAIVACDVFRVFSMLLTSHEPMLLLGLATIWAWTRWRKSSGRRRQCWAIAIGFFAGWAAITRPADAVCYAVPVGLAILLDVFRPQVQEVGTRNLRRLLITGVLVIAGAAPFLSLQIVFNQAVTGRWYESPYTYYLDRDQPINKYGFHPYDPAARPQSRIQQKQDFYDTFYAPYVQRHQLDQFAGWWGRLYLQEIADADLPTRAAIPLLFIGLLAVGVDRRRAVLVAVAGMFLLIYPLNPFFLKHYAVVVAPSFLALATLGIRTAATAASRWRESVDAALALGWLAICLSLLPEANPLWPEAHQVGDETYNSAFMRAAKLELTAASDLRRPAVILVTYHSGDLIVAEPVYNTDVAWPDEAPIIFAHDLGPRNIEAFRYYAERQPDRYFYRWDQSKGRIEDLGYARDLAR